MANDDTHGGQPTDAELEKDIEVTKVEDAATLTTEQVAQLQKERDTLAAQKDHWRKKAIDPASGKPYRDLVSVKPVEQAKPNQAPPAIAQLEKDVQGLKAVEEKRLFGHQHGLSPEAVDKVFSYAQGNAMKPEDALKDDFVKSGLSSLQARERLSRNVPGPSHRAASVGGKSFAEMKPDERRANFAKVTGAER